MEKMPFHAYLDDSTSRPAGVAPTASVEWHRRLPVLSGVLVTLRELEMSDAPSLLSMLAVEEVARFISPPPTSIEGFERFISWAQRKREEGEYVCFGVVPGDMTQSIGLFQIRQLDASFESAEWGFAIGASFWGTGVFVDASRLAVEFAIKTMGVRRLEARAAVANGRGNGALRKIGATQEGVLRGSFLRRGEYLDQRLWSILDTDLVEGRLRWRLTGKAH